MGPRSCPECETSGSSLSDEALAGLSALKSAAVEARKAAEVAAGELFSDEPLPGVGSDTWRALWKAARDYSVTEAYLGREFPVTVEDRRRLRALPATTAGRRHGENAALPEIHG